MGIVRAVLVAVFLLALLAGIALTVLEIRGYRRLTRLFAYLGMDHMDIMSRVAANDQDGLVREMLRKLREKNVLLLFRTERNLRTDGHPQTADGVACIRDILNGLPGDAHSFRSAIPDFVAFRLPASLTAQWREFQTMTDLMCKAVTRRRMRHSEHRRS